jgi:hypothetical protein
MDCTSATRVSSTACRRFLGRFKLKRRIIGQRY